MFVESLPDEIIPNFRINNPNKSYEGKYSPKKYNYDDETEKLVRSLDKVISSSKRNNNNESERRFNYWDWKIKYAEKQNTSPSKYNRPYIYSTNYDTISKSHKTDYLPNYMKYTESSTPYESDNLYIHSNNPYSSYLLTSDNTRNTKIPSLNKNYNSNRFTTTFNIAGGSVYPVERKSTNFNIKRQFTPYSEDIY